MVDLKIAIDERMNAGNTPEEVLATIDFSEWHFSTDTDLQNLIQRSISEAFRNTLKWEPPTVEFESDGRSMTVCINYGSNWNDGSIFFTADICEMIDAFIANTANDVMDGGDEARIELAKCLRLCAFKLEQGAHSSIEAGA